MDRRSAAQCMTHGIRTWRLIKIAVVVVACSLAVEANSQESNKPAVMTPKLKSPDQFTLIGPRSFLTDYPAVNSDDSVNAVVEIPTGTNGKWEVSKSDGSLRWEFKNGSPRVVKYLGYPGNYGMIPQTFLPEEHGGDGDPLDILVIGQAVPRGSIVRVKLIGMLKLVDDGELDYKLIAILKGSPMDSVNEIDELDKRFPGVTSIIQTWFTNYKGSGKLVSNGYADAKEARRVLSIARRAYDKQGKSK